MYDIFMDALIDSAKMIPLLLLIYILIEYLEFRFGKNNDKILGSKKHLGPLVGALFGCIPQCGFSVIATTLYVRRVITIGALLAVYLSTSDEAIPVILAQPDKIGSVLPILITKVIIALIAGYFIDIILSKRMKKMQTSENAVDDLHVTEKGCCGHDCKPKKLGFKELIIHPLIHTLKVFLYIFIISFALNYVISLVGEENLGNFLLSNSIFQPVLAGLVGLIPNCAASVIVTEMFLKGAISFGSAIAGLSTAAGLGLIVLFKENKSIKENLSIVGLLYVIGVVSGIIIQLIFK